MTIQSYTDLRAEVSSYLYDRADLYNRIPTFIQLAEAQMNRRLRVRRMTARATATVDSDFIMLPASFAGPRAIYLNGTTGLPLEFVSDPDAMAQRKALLQASGEPTSYTVVGRQFEFGPAPQQSYTAQLVFYEKLPALSDSNPTNWMLVDHPDAYLYGALLQSAPWLKEDDRITTWGGLFTQIVADIQASDKSDTTAPRLSMPERIDIQ